MKGGRLIPALMAMVAAVARPFRRAPTKRTITIDTPLAPADTRLPARSPGRSGSGYQLKLRRRLLMRKPFATDMPMSPPVFAAMRAETFRKWRHRRRTWRRAVRLAMTAWGQKTRAQERPQHHALPKEKRPCIG